MDTCQEPFVFENIIYDVDSPVFLEDLPPTNESCIVTIESKSKKLERERGGLDDKLINNIKLNLN